MYEDDAFHSLFLLCPRRRAQPRSRVWPPNFLIFGKDGSEDEGETAPVSDEPDDGRKKLSTSNALAGASYPDLPVASPYLSDDSDDSDDSYSLDNDAIRIGITSLRQMEAERDPTVARKIEARMTALPERLCNWVYAHY